MTAMAALRFFFFLLALSYLQVLHALPFTDASLDNLRRQLLGEDYTIDLRVNNLSVERIRYAVDDEHKTTTSKVVATWDDHPTASAARKILDANSDYFTYDLQVWVDGWGFDALWHPANRQLTTADSMAILDDFPQDVETHFRVRMKVLEGSKYLPNIFATETEGPWSEVVTLPPSSEAKLEDIAAFFLKNKIFFLLLAGCISMGSVIVLQLLLPKGSQSTTLLLRKMSSSKTSEDSGADDSEEIEELQQEICELRHELQDSEAEVHRLMVYRGYNLDSLDADALATVEAELKQTLQAIQDHKRRQKQL